MKTGDKVTFMVTNPKFNDAGEFYTMRVKEILVNGIRFEKDGNDCLAMYEDIKIVGVAKA